MRFSTSVSVVSLAAVALAAPPHQPHHPSKPSPVTNSTTVYPTSTDVADVSAAQATAKSASPTTHVKGKSFDRYVSIWFENTDYDMAAADPNFAYFAKKGITLENNFALTHPSEPNYMAAVGGDYFGLNGDPFTQVPENISSVVDLLEDKGISWGLYQEDMPYTGFEGFAWVNQETGANDYVRKHNPEILYNSVVNSPKRLEVIKNTTLFYEDLKANKLPQWMFITPNMTSDGHDTTVTVAGKWLYNFLQPLLNDTNFMQNTLVLITFDENETYAIQNRVFSILLGDALDPSLVGTSDASYYNHYSEIATVSANWGLHTLGRFDVGANVFANVAKKTGDKIREWSGKPTLDNRYFNLSYPGIFSGVEWAKQPAPNADLEVHGRTVLPSIKAYWGKDEAESYYSSALEIPDGLNPPVYPNATTRHF